MNQKSTDRWIIASVFWFFLGGIPIFVVLLLLFPIEPLFMIIYWVGGILGLVVVLALENKYPSFRSGPKAFALPMVVSILLGGVMYGFVGPQLYNLSNTNFRISDINYTSQYPTGYTYYARIRNDGIDGSQVVTCIVTKADLNTISKSQTVYLSHNEEKSISFYFSATQVGTEWKEFTIKIGS